MADKEKDYKFIQTSVWPWMAGFIAVKVWGVSFTYWSWWWVLLPMYPWLWLLIQKFNL